MAAEFPFAAGRGYFALAEFKQMLLRSRTTSAARNNAKSWHVHERLKSWPVWGGDKQRDVEMPLNQSTWRGDRISICRRRHLSTSVVRTPAQHAGS